MERQQHEWKFLYGFQKPECSEAMMKLAEWANKFCFQGKFRVCTVSHNWNQPLNLRGPIGLQGATGSTGPQGPTNPSGAAVEPVPLEDLKLVIECETIQDYTIPHPSGEPWIPRVYDSVTKTDFIGSIYSGLTYAPPVCMNGDVARLLTGIVQPTAATWKKWCAIEDSVDMSRDDFFALDGQFVEGMTNTSQKLDPALPVFAIQTESKACTGLYATHIEFLASALDDHLLGVLKAIMWQACRPAPGAHFE